MQGGARAARGARECKGVQGVARGCKGCRGAEHKAAKPEAAKADYCRPRQTSITDQDSL